MRNMTPDGHTSINNLDRTYILPDLSLQFAFVDNSMSHAWSHLIMSHAIMSFIPSYIAIDVCFGLNS